MASDTADAPDQQFKAKVFISYSRKDMVFADRLEAALKTRGFEPLIDRSEIYAFEDWWERIQALIGRADTIVFVLSPDAVTSEVALKEVTLGAELNKRFAPIVCRRVEDLAVPEALRRLNFIFFDDPAVFEVSADRLAQALRTDLGWVRQHTEYGEAERRWAAADRPRGLLLQTPTLEVAEYWIASRPAGAPEPTQEIRHFVLASRQGARSTQRLRRIAQGSIFTLMLAIILGLVGWINQDTIKEQWRWYTVTRPYMVSRIQPFLLSAEKEQRLRPKDSFRECAPEQDKDYCPEMVVIPAGSFTMGSPLNAKGQPLAKDEQPQHAVAIGRPFAVSKFELTFDEWDTCVAYGDCAQGISDMGWGRGRQPVINVSWDNAQRYVAWLSKVTARPYRLLSEAEYEYAARGGKQTVYPWGNEIKVTIPCGFSTCYSTVMANCKGCDSEWGGHDTGPVGSFAPNGFALYDMVGNVWEWVEDCWHRTYVDAPHDGSAWVGGGDIVNADCENRVLRGGSFDSDPDYLRSAARGWLGHNDRHQTTGFRIARTLVAP
jgi:formylglycine-generating enzyme required for sulfatase activity